MSLPIAFEQKTFFKTCRQLITQQKYQDALFQIKQALRGDQLDAAGCAQAGRLLDRLDIAKDLKVAILGQFTTSYLAPVLKATAASQGKMLAIEAESYDSVMQSLLSLDDKLDLVILLPWHQRLLTSGSRSPSQRIKEEFSFWQQAWQLVSQNTNARIIQVGYDWNDAGASGQFLAGQSDGDIQLIRQLNQQLRNNLPNSAYFVDLEQVSGVIGRQQFYDARSYHWTKQPLSEQGLVLLAQYLWAGIRATLTGPKKVLVLDLDNTLWGGVVGEVGAQCIELGDNPTGEGFKNFQQVVKQLAANGCVLAVCSKNNDADAREPFMHHPDMLLKLDDFAVFKAGWGPKSEAIRQIAAELNLGLDSFVFFDDSKVEQQEVRMALPEVEVVDVPADPSDYRQALLDGLWFESIQLTTEDGSRTKHYQHERQRIEEKSSYHSIEDYLTSLDMKADVRELNEADIDRVVQLMGKTNQFNLTTRRHSREDVLDILAEPGSMGLTLRLADKFGDYGLVSVILAANDGETLIIDSWLMSCRTIARTLEHYFFNCLLTEAKTRNVKRIAGEYIPTAKNILVKTLYQDLGCSATQKNFTDTSVHNSDSESQWYELKLNGASLATTLVNRWDGND